MPLSKMGLDSLRDPYLTMHELTYKIARFVHGKRFNQSSDGGAKIGHFAKYVQ